MVASVFSSDIRSNICQTKGEPSHSHWAVGEQELILPARQPLANFRCHPDNVSVTWQLPCNTFRVSWIPALWRRLALSPAPITAPARSEQSQAAQAQIILPPPL